MKRLRTKLSYANVLSTLCLCLLLGGGTAFASMSLLAKNSVGTKQLKKGAVTPAKLSKGAKTALKGAPGAQGPRGAVGAVGPVSSLGASGALVIDASAPEMPLTTTSSPISLSGKTSWTAPTDTVGLLVAQLKLRLATNGEEFESCGGLVEIFDNGERVTTLSRAISAFTPSATTLIDYLTESPAYGIGLIDRSTTHAITATYDGTGASGCAAGAKLVGLRIIVQPLG